MTENEDLTSKIGIRFYYIQCHKKGETGESKIRMLGNKALSIMSTFLCVLSPFTFFQELLCATCHGHTDMNFAN